MKVYGMVSAAVAVVLLGGCASMKRQTALSMGNTMALMDLHYIYKDAHDNDLEFHLAYIPSDMREPAEMYDPPYMAELYDLALEKAENGYSWESKPPEFAN